MAIEEETERQDVEKGKEQEAQELARHLMSDTFEEADAKAVVLAFLGTTGTEEWWGRTFKLQRAVSSIVNANEKENILEQENLFSALIQGGREEYLERVQEIESAKLDAEEKQQAYEHLEESYKDSIVLEKLMKAQVIESLLTKLLDPFQLNPDLQHKMNTYYDGERREWISRWDPETDYGRGTARFLSPKTIEAIRKGLGDYFEMQRRIENVKEKVKESLGRTMDENDETPAILKSRTIEKYDKAAAQVILDEVLGRHNPRLVGNAKILIGPLSITVVFEKEFDYDNYHGGGIAVGASAGVHISQGGGILNLVHMGGSYLDREKTIVHENEHTLNEILVHGTKESGLEREHENLPGSIKSQYLKLKMQILRGIEISDQDVDEVMENMAKKMRLNEGNKLLARFADEALASMLESQRSAGEVFKTLTTSKLYSYLHPAVLANEIQSGYQWTAGKAIGIMNRPFEMFFSWDERYEEKKVRFEQKQKEWDDFFVRTTPDGEIDPSLQKACERMGRRFYKISQEGSVTEEEVKKWQRDIIDAIERLQRVGLTKNEIRALLAGENPLRWSKLAREFCTHSRDYGPEQIRNLPEAKRYRVARNLSKNPRGTIHKGWKVRKLIDMLSKEEDEREKSAESENSDKDKGT